MNEEEKKAIESVKSMFGDITIEELIKDKNFNITIYSLGILDILKVIAIVDNQQKEIERLNEIINSRYYHDLKCRELEKEINENWKDKIRELKEQVKKEKTNNPYDFIYIINDLLGE